ncbi:MAG TPA: helix-turn-helix domain-containing protein, partial [Nitrosopumilaceae archaeon]|nr:helix-turn-helix domain-containing protein [Nitrosopumilaceae archaeon]
MSLTDNQFAQEKIATTRIDELGSEISKLLDLDELDALLYLNLLRMGPVTASALAKELNIDRTKAYRTIDKLLHLKIVSTTFSKPKLCIANKPEDVLKNILDTKVSQVEKIRNAKDYLINTIRESIPTNYKSNLPSFHIAQGTNHIYSEIEKLLENATGTVFIATTVKDLSKMYHTDIPEKIKICEKNGGKVYLLTQFTGKEYLPFIKRFGASESKVG